jgi:hypothetical protein
VSLYAWAVRDGDVVNFCKGNFDYDKDVDGTDSFVFKQNFGRSQILAPCPPDGPAPVERSWQSETYAEGDDGYNHMGISWTYNRFTDNGNGTVTDNLTGLIWLKNANCVGAQTWEWALLVSSGVCDGVCGLTDGSSLGDWRLPNVKELTSLIDYDYVDPAIHMSSIYFSNVQSAPYWSSTTYAVGTVFAWFVDMSNGFVFSDSKSYNGYVWPVRGGHPY